MKTPSTKKFELRLVNTQRAFAGALAGFAVIVCTVVVCVLSQFGDSRLNVLYLLMTFGNLIIARYAHVRSVIAEVRADSLLIVDPGEPEADITSFSYRDISEYGFTYDRSGNVVLLIVATDGARTRMSFRRTYQNADVMKTFTEALPHAIEVFDTSHAKTAR